MKINTKALFTAAMIYFMAAAAYADSNIYPLPAIFKSKNINNSRFEKIFNANSSYYIKKFTDEFGQKFPNKTDELTDRNKYNTFAAYVNLARVSEHHFNKEKLVDVYLPMTVSLNFVNMATSETLYSESLTKYAKYKTTKDIINDNKNLESFEKLYKQTYDEIIGEITSSAKEKFKPYAISIKVIDKYKDLYVLDKGLTNGIAINDLLTDNQGNQLSVVYSDLDYSVAKSTFGALKKDSSFVKYTTSSVMQLKKPKVLFINDFDNEKVYNMFASALGNNADFSLITVDKTFYDMQTALVSLNKNFRFQNTQNREVPDYFFKLTFSKPLFAVYPTNKSFVNTDKYAIFVCGNIFDKQGQVVYSTCVNDEISDDVVADIKFSDEAQFEVVTKNSFAKLTQDIAQNVKFKTASIPIDKVNGNIFTLKDSNHLLNYGDNVTVTKKIKTEQNGTEILVPTWVYRVINISGSTVECEQVRAFADNLPEPSKKDLVKINTISTNKLKTNAYNYVLGDSEIDGNEVNLKYFDLAAFTAISSEINLPVLMNQEKFKEQVDELNAGYGFKRKITVPKAKSANTVNAKYKINLISEKKKGSLLEQKYEIICGLIVKNASSEPYKTGLKQEVTIVVPPDNNDAIIEHELLKYIYPLFKSVAQNFNAKK